MVQISKLWGVVFWTEPSLCNHSTLSIPWKWTMRKHEFHEELHIKYQDCKSNTQKLKMPLISLIDFSLKPSCPICLQQSLSSAKQKTETWNRMHLVTSQWQFWSHLLLPGTVNYFVSKNQTLAVCATMRNLHCKGSVSVGVPLARAQGIFPLSLSTKTQPWNSMLQQNPVSLNGQMNVKAAC